MTKMSKDVAAVFNAFPVKHRKMMMALRQLIYDVAKSIEEVGDLEETLKWGEISYLTARSRSGTTIRIDWKEANPDWYAIYFNCQTNLVARFRKLFPSDFEFDGNRSIMFDVNKPMPVESLASCIAAALTYHREKKDSKSGQ